jgi:hypothetical protein
VPLFAAVHGVDEPIASVIAHRQFPVRAHAAHAGRRPQRLYVQAPAGRACVADATAAQLSWVLIAAEDLAPGCDHHGEVEADLRVEQGSLYALAPSLAPLAPVLAEPPWAATQGRRALRRTS